MKFKYFKKFAAALLVTLIFLTIGTFVVSKANADTPFPSGAITATYNSATGQLNASGNYAWNLCNSTNKKKWVGSALFINGAFPSSSVPDSRALDGTGMHLANGGNACTTDPGSWSDTHTLTSAPTSVCVVVYDVEINTGAPNVGDRSTTGAGKDFNEDNSYHNNGDSYSIVSCTTPTVITPSPTPIPECEEGDCASPTPTPTPTSTQTPNVGGPGDGKSDGLGCGSRDCSNKTSTSQGGQVLGASTGPTQAVLGLSATSGDSASALSFIQLISAFGFTSLGFGLFKKHA